MKKILEEGKVNYNEKSIKSEILKFKLSQFSKYLGAKTGTGPREIQVISGNRDSIHNEAVGGATKSRHLTGDAADVAVYGMSNKDLAIYAHKSRFFTRTIYYPKYSLKGALRPHVHLDIRPSSVSKILIYPPKTIGNSVSKHSYSNFNY